MWNIPQAYTHTDIHSVYPLLQPLTGLKTEAMQQRKGAENTAGGKERDSKLVYSWER